MAFFSFITVKDGIKNCIIFNITLRIPLIIKKLNIINISSNNF